MKKTYSLILATAMALPGLTAGVELVPMGSTWRFMKGVGEASSPIPLWRTPEFPDMSFQDAASPFWYGDVRSGGTSLADMRGGYSCIFLRQAFVISEPGDVSALELDAYIDDGFVAWVNGTEVARVRVNPVEPVYTDTASTYSPTEPVPTLAYPLPPPGNYLVPGTNILAIQAFNVSLDGSSDFGFDGALNGTILETTPPVIADVHPAPGGASSLTAITVTFSEAVLGVDADDLRVNGNPANTVSGGGDTYTFIVGQPPDGAVSVAWTPGHGITDQATPGNGFDASGPTATWSYTLADTDPPEVALLFPTDGAAVRTLTQLEVTFNEPVLGVEATDLLINGVPASGVTQPAGQPYVFTFPEPATGLVSVAWATGHGITDDAASPNPFGGGTWSLTLDPTLPPWDLVINEILASNVGAGGRADEDGELQDWIELHNRGTGSVDLSDWSLSDDPAIPGLWPFPARTLDPGEFLIVFASGKDRKPVSGELHTTFKLSASGEHLGLYTPDSPRKLAAGFEAYPEQRNDISYGIDPSGDLRYFAGPTPGASNAQSTIVGVVAPLHVNVERGHFKNPFDLLLSCDTPGATLRYTTDGSEPTGTSPVFPERLTVSDTTLFRAAGFLADHLPSRTATHTYFFNLPSHVRSVPMISIVTDQAHLTGPSGIINLANVNKHGLAWERPSSVEWIRPEDNGGFQIDCGIRLQGSDYHRGVLTADSKFSFRLYFRGDYGPGRLNYPAFPLTPVDRFDGMVLRGGLNEQGNPFIRDEITRRLSHDMGQIATHGTMAVVFINGEYWDNGASPVYNPCERIHEEFMQEHLGGGDEWDVTKPFWNEVVDGSWTDFENMFNYIRYTADVSSPTDYTTIGQWLDLTNYVDYVILNTYAATGDWPNNNWRAGRDQAPEGIWRFVVWDAEWAMGIYGRPINLNTFPQSGGGPNDSGMSGDSPIARIYQGLKSSAEFQLLWSDRMQKHFHHGGALTEENITDRFRELESELSELIPTMDTRILNWARFRLPYYLDYCDAEGLLSSVEAPEFGQHGGRIPEGYALSMSAPGGTIYYTVDGSDPRTKFSGNPAGSARTYSAPMPLNTTVTVRARARAGSTWSALTEATFIYASLGIPLRITEVMYNPIGGSPYEFIEIENTSPSAVDLGGMSLEGIGFTFTEGTILEGNSRLVLGSNTDTNSWAARYSGVTPRGWFAGNLSNGGERIVLVDAAGYRITSVEYNDGGGWPEEADGEGRSLEILDADGDPDDPANWQASAGVHGTPGHDNSPPPSQPVSLNELMAENISAVDHGGTYPDWVEIRNEGASPVGIEGWSLSDDGDERKYVFPAGTTVPGSGHLVVWCDAETNLTPGLHAGFSLDNDGETVSLYDPSTTRVDAVTYGLQIADASVGRIGVDWTLTTPTPNQPNLAAALDSTSNLGINEWMADPVAGEDDWIELYNRSTTLPVALTGIYLATSNTISCLKDRSYLPPQGHAQIRADENVGPDHVDFKLPASGELITLYDATGAQLEQVLYGVQTEGVSQGRLPDGSANVLNFPGTASPAAMNYLSTYTGPVLNEILARNSHIDVGGGVTVDYLEIHNPGVSSFDLGGMSLSVNRAKAGEWIFPPGTALGANQFLLIPCDESRAASTNPAGYNLGASLDGESGGAYLFNPSGQLVDSIDYGPQIRDLSIGPDGGEWKLLSAPTPATANAPAAALGTNTSLVINEWMADPASGADWFELYNPLGQPVDLSTISLSDDPSLIGENKFLPKPLSFIGAGGFVKWVADANPGQGRNHVNFRLDGKGDALLVYNQGGRGLSVQVDVIAFGEQVEEVSVGSLPDGSSTVIPFPGSASPAASNYRLLNEIVINEILTHTDPPFEDAIELWNPTPATVDLGGWYLSNSRDHFTKFRIPDGVTIPAGGYAVIYEYQFNVGGTNAFDLNSAHGDEVWLSKAPGGILSGDRVFVDLGAAGNGISFGRLVTSDSVDYPALLQTTFGITHPTSLADFRSGNGAVNAGPVIGPVVLNEILYHPSDATIGNHEYIELHNHGGSAVDLFDAAYPTNCWRLGGGIDYPFPPGTRLEPRSYLVVVDFDPELEPLAAAAFRDAYGLSTHLPLVGPFSRNLGNSGDEVILYRPDTPQLPPHPDAGFVPYLVADRVAYRNASPWPAGQVDGGGHSLQRNAATLYGNEPLNWFGGIPTPGADNVLAMGDTDGDGIPDGVEIAMGLDPENPVDGAADTDGDGASNYEEYVAGTDHLDPDSTLRIVGISVGAQALLAFDAVATKSYSLLYTDALTNAVWTKLADVPPQTSDQTTQILDSTSGARRYYLLVTPATP